MATMFENLFRNVASMVYLVGVLLAATVSISIGVLRCTRRWHKLPLFCSCVCPAS